jgi:hypothetical protein
MTKEEILKDHELYIKYEGMGQQEDLFEAMEAYAKNQAIAFAEWMASEGYVTYDGFDRWIAPHNNNNVYSANELYSMFLTHQSQDKGTNG